MTLRLNGSTSGYTEIDAPAVAGSNTLRLPTGNGSDGNILGTDGAGNLSWVNGRMVLATAQNTTSGTAIDFTGIPSWAKRVTVMFNGVSTNGSSNPLVQIGAGSVDSASYFGSTTVLNNVAVTSNWSSGVLVKNSNAASSTFHGLCIIVLVGSNVWSASSNVAHSNDATVYVSGGSKTLAGTLDRLRLTTVNGTDTFDAGSINILYEG